MFRSLVFSLNAARSRESGQVVALVALAMVVMTGVAGLAIDAGYWWKEKRAQQVAADAATTAGLIAYANAQQNQSAAATSTAREYVNRQKGTSGLAVVDSGVTVTVTPAQNQVSVKIVRSRQTFFARIFGKNSVTIGAKATGQVQSVTRVPAGTDVFPVAKMRESPMPWGQEITIKTNGGNGFQGNYGGVNIPFGNPCKSSGGSDFRSNLGGPNSKCAIGIGDLIETEPGNMGGPTRQGLNNRLQGNTQTFNDIVSVDSSGIYHVKAPTSPRLVLIPIIENTNGTATWPNGKKNVKIVGFAWFVITSPAPGNGNGDSTIVGKLVKMAPSFKPSAYGTPSTYNGITWIGLTS